MLRNLTFVSCTICSFQILASDQNKFLLFSSNFWATLVTYKKPLLIVFWATFWEITGNVLENLEQLVESPSRSPQVSSFFSEDLPSTKRSLPLPRKCLRLVASSTTPQPPSVQHCHATRLSQGHVHFILFFFPFLSFSFFGGQFSYRLARLCPDKLWAWRDVHPHQPHIHGTDLIVKSVYT